MDQAPFRIRGKQNQISAASCNPQQHMTGYTINFLLLGPYLFLLQWFILPHTWPILMQCCSPPSCSPAMHLQAFVGCSERVWRMCERLCLRVRDGGIAFWWMVGVSFLLYMWKKTPRHAGLQGEHSLVNVTRPGNESLSLERGFQLIPWCPKYHCLPIAT